MRLRGQDRTVTHGGMNNEVVAYTIKQDAKMFRILVDKLYSNKPEAVVRELCANAYDAMVAAGKADVPFSIHLPTFLEPWLTVADTGIGLSDRDIKTVYTCIGESLKNDTNKLIGGLGLGCKSPLSYTDSFTVTSTFNGERRIYSVYLDTEGHPQLTQVGDTIVTHDCNGIEVQMPVQEKDEYDFRKAVEKYASYYPVHPTVNNSVDLKLGNYTSVLEGDKWRLLSWKPTNRWNRDADTPVATAVMGHVPYPLDFTSIKNACDDALYNEFVQPLSNYSIQLTFDIGDLDVSASRESLSYDPTTVANIVEVFKDVADTLNKLVQDKVDQASTLWEAFHAYQDMKDINRISKRLKNNAKTFTWKGKDYSTNAIVVDYTPDYDKGTRLYLVQSSRFTSYKTLGALGNYKSRQEWHPKKDTNGDYILDSNGDKERECRQRLTITDKNTVFVWVDPTRKKQHRLPSRLHSWMKGIIDTAGGEPHSLCIIETDDVLCRDRMYALMGHPPSNQRYIFHDDVPDLAANRTYKKVAGVTVQVGANEYQPKVFSYQNRTRGLWGIQPGQHWKELSRPVNLDLQRGYYVDIRKGRPQSPKLDNSSTCSTLDTILKGAKYLGFLPDNPVLYGCDGSKKNKMKDHARWENIYDYVDVELLKFVSSPAGKLAQDTEAMSEDYSDYKDLMSALSGHLKSIKDATIVAEIKIIDDVLSGTGASRTMEMGWIKMCCLELQHVTGTECAAKLVLDKRGATGYTHVILQRYPLLTTLSKLRYDDIVDTIGGIIDYINSK